MKIETPSILKAYRTLVGDMAELTDVGLDTLLLSYSMIERAVKARGVEDVIFLALPQICSDFERSLEIGWWKRTFKGTLSGLTSKFGVPRLFSPLFLKVFTAGGVLLESPDVEAIRLLRQALRLFKKIGADCPAKAEHDAKVKFREIELELLPPVLSWGDTDLVCRSGYPCLVDLVRRCTATEQVYRRLSEQGPVELASIYRDASYAQLVFDRVSRSFRRPVPGQFHPKHGPGAVSESYSNSKFEFPTWNDRLDKFFPYEQWGVPNESYLHQYDPLDGFSANERSELDPPAKLIAVPKDYKGPRLIASEPISSQYIQQGIMAQMRRDLKGTFLRHSICFEDQAPSRELALSGSFDGKVATIDLSSASDRLSCGVVEAAFRRNFVFLEHLNAARTPRVDMGDMGVLDCNKFAAQGAAFTFPVQTVIYACLCIGVILADDPSKRMSEIAREVRVYGDDMIVPEHVFDRVCALCTSLQLVVNREKSFARGKFRESCGMDGYSGVDITPTYIRVIGPRSPAEQVSVLEASNALYMKGYLGLSNSLLETIGQKHLRDVAYVRPGSTTIGIASTNVWARRKRYNADLQRHESRIWDVAPKVFKTSINGHERLHQWFIEKPRPDVCWVPGEVEHVEDRRVLRWVPTYQLEK